MKFRCTVFIYMLIYTAICSGETVADITNYVSEYKELAIEEMHRTGIPASIKLGQAILESNAGRSKLALQSNNHFGIKCKKNWKGKKYYHKDDDYDKKGNLMKSCFRAYPSVKHSYQDHSAFLMKWDRYSFLFTYHPTDYKQWAYGLKSAGYATAKEYAQKVIKLIERYNLNQYDSYPSPNPVKPPVIDYTFKENEDLVVFGDDKNDGAELLEKTKYPEKPDIVVPKPSKPPVPVEEKIILFPVFKKQPFLVNTLRAITAKGKTLEKIAEEYDISVKRLLKYNELEKGQNLIDGQYLFLKKKKKTYLGDLTTHKVLKGETMYSIAQRFGIRLKSLLKRNRMKKGQEPLVGEQIVLKGKKVKQPPALK